jgi:hypothetical protein
VVLEPFFTREIQAIIATKTGTRISKVTRLQTNPIRHLFRRRVGLFEEEGDTCRTYFKRFWFANDFGNLCGGVMD